MESSHWHAKEQHVHYSIGHDTIEDVIFSYYRFISPDAIHLLDFEDFRYLESQNCFRIPSRPVLDKFVEAYRLNVHSYQPLLDWDEFRRSCQQESIMPKTVSLFLVQAILFAASSVCPSNFLDVFGN
jgi:hypothetical protein